MVRYKGMNANLEDFLKILVSIEALLAMMGIFSFKSYASELLKCDYLQE